MMEDTGVEGYIRMAQTTGSYLKFSTESPVHYLKSGLFTAEVGWQHHQVRHHKDIEVMIGLSGSIALSVAQQSFVLEQGDILTVFPNETIVGTHPVVTPGSYIWFHVTPVAPVVSESPSSICLPRFAHLQQEAQVVITAHQLLDIAHDQSAQAIVADFQASLVLLTIANQTANQRQNITSQQSLINSVKEWMRINLAKQPSVSDIADHFYLNADYLNRIFKHETGDTLTGYMNAMRIEYAKLLLLGTNRSIQTIAGLAHFNDSKYFARVFKQLVDLSPRAYRQAYTHTYLNNNQADPGVDLQPLLDRVEHQKDFE